MKEKHRFLKHPFSSFSAAARWFWRRDHWADHRTVVLNDFDINGTNYPAGNDLPEIFLALLVILMMKRSYENRFKFGFWKKNHNETEYGFGFHGELLILLLNIIPNLFLGIPLESSHGLLLLTVTGGIAQGFMRGGCLPRRNSFQ